MTQTICLFLWLLSCGPKTGAPTAVTMTKTPRALSAASTGVQNPDLAQLLEEHWEAMMSRWPTWATQLGDHRFDHRLPVNTPESWDQVRSGTDQWLKRTLSIDKTALNAEDAITLAVLQNEFESAKATAVCLTERWNVAPVNNAFSTMNGLAQIHPVHTPTDGANLIARYKAIPDYIDGAIASLEQGKAAGLLPNQQSLARTIEIIDDELSRMPKDWALLRPVHDPHPDWSTLELSIFKEDAHATVRDLVRPAFIAYRDFLHGVLLPVARPADKAGIGHLPNGAACYAASIRRETTLSLSADEIHQIGLLELARIHAEFSVIGQRVWGEPDKTALFQRLRTDPDLVFDSPTAIHQKAIDALAKAKAAMPKWFGILPKTDCVVVPIPDYEAKYTTIAYYRPPTPGGAKPGEYFINLSAPTTRPRFEAEVLAYHESIPGHHLQIAIAQERHGLPAIRRHLRSTAYVEGWGLYTERLADEMGLYTSDLDRLGMLSFDAWRASRLVVDTGIHAKGWSRARAIQFLSENTPLASNNIDIEVDRYISWPGQALAYKLGQRAMNKLRAQAETSLGEAFHLPSFHDQILAVGAIPLPALQRHIDRWIASSAK